MCYLLCRLRSHDIQNLSQEFVFFFGQIRKFYESPKMNECGLCCGELPSPSKVHTALSRKVINKTEKELFFFFGEKMILGFMVCRQRLDESRESRTKKTRQITPKGHLLFIPQ